ncbi:hypothetical protein AB1L42_06985 [Thalassoglobus sp. JC818]|uniref:hypothetical protein n=1 Tax=Thalassoglobus sp. JC818 TaxID=3232136 RepID=UPI00345801F2
MTSFSKILAVFVTVASLGFVGFAIAATFGGPDWSGVMSEKYFDAYEITRSPSADRAWQAVRGSDQGQVASSKVLPEVLTKIMDEVYQKQQQELQNLQQREPALREKIAALQKLNEMDDAALTAYVDQLRARLTAINAEFDELSNKVTGMSVDSSKLETQVQARRDDVVRLGQQVREVEADMFRLREVLGQLRDTDYQLQEQLDRAKERQKLLEEYNPAPVN